MSGEPTLDSHRFMAFDEAAMLERGAGADERDEVWRVDRAPTGLGGLDELERHRDPGSLGTESLGDPGPVTHGREGRLDQVRGAEVDPVLGGEVVEREQLIHIIGDLGGGFAELGAVGEFYRGGGAARVVQ